MKPVISLKDIQLTRGENFSLSVENLELLPQRIYALTGANGAGKSTLLRIMALLTLPQRGRVNFADAEGEELSRQRQHVTLVEQSPYLLDGSVADNLAFGLKLRGIRGAEQTQRIKEALALVDLTGFERRKTKKLSGGEAQRVALARALVLKPNVLLLDEPTANIDSKSLQSFEDLLARLPAAGATVVFATHDLALPKRLKAEMLHIENGKLLDRPHRRAESFDKTQTENSYGTIL